MRRSLLHIVRASFVNMFVCGVTAGGNLLATLIQASVLHEPMRRMATGVVILFCALAAGFSAGAFAHAALAP